jgi:hypothetical protein
VLHYGEVPLVSFDPVRFAKTQTGVGGILLASWDIPAAFMENDVYHWLEFDVSIKVAGTPGPYEGYLSVDYGSRPLGESINDWDSGFAVDVGTHPICRVRFNNALRTLQSAAVIRIESLKTQEGLGLDFMAQSAPSDGATTAIETIYNTSAQTRFLQGATPLIAASVANTLVLKLVIPPDSENITAITAHGIAKLTQNFVP